MRNVPVPDGRHAIVLSTLIASALLPGCGGGNKGGFPDMELLSSREGSVPEIAVLSSRADLVSGGDALIEVKTLESDPRSLRITLNGLDVTDRLAVRPNGRYQGLVSELRPGTNELVASLGSDAKAATLIVTNHDKQGPIISGPQVEPYVCETELFGLGQSAPPKCEAPTRYEFFYKSVGSSETDRFLPYDISAPPSASTIATTTTDQGMRVPFIVRRERGVINRAVYDIAVLFQPGENWQPGGSKGAWNGKLVMHFNGGTKRWHNQSINGSIPNVLTGAYAGMPDTSLTGGDIALARGFAVATSTISQVNNPVTSTETAMMVKEHFIKRYGPVRYTIGLGCSGGSMMQHLTANNYPGLLDGLIAQCPLPDMWTVVMGHAAFDFPLLGRYFSTSAPNLWSERSARVAVYGGADGDGSPTAASGVFRQEWFNPGDSCTTRGAPWVYDPAKNPGGKRCALQDFQSQILGLRSSSEWGPIESALGRGFAASPIDNIGVQYGLAALLRGEIGAEQFVDLNKKIGGVDIDGNWTATRKEASQDSLANLYRSGQVNDARLLNRVPMVDVATYGPLDLIHPLVATEMIRARLFAAHGHADNLIQLITIDDQGPNANNPIGLAPSFPMRRAAFLIIDKWLAGMEADRSGAPLDVKVRNNRPSDASDSCYADGKPGAKCPEAFRLPKMVAGAPLAGVIMKCQLKPLQWSDYGAVEFNESQKIRLQQAFPEGVCDWSKPGVGQQPSQGTWLTFARKVGGEPLGPEPKSAPGRRVEKPKSPQ